MSPDVVGDVTGDVTISACVVTSDVPSSVAVTDTIVTSVVMAPVGDVAAVLCRRYICPLVGNGTGDTAVMLFGTTSEVHWADTNGSGVISWVMSVAVLLGACIISQVMSPPVWLRLIEL